MTLYLLEVDLFFKLERRGEKKWKTNLVHQSGNGVLEFLGDIDEKVDIMSSMGFDGTLGTNSSQVSFAVGILGVDEEDPPFRASRTVMYW